jgi:isoleucyl-tRNA synthetase
VLITICQLTAPLTPFIAEAMYKNLTDEESVHLTDWPEFDESQLNAALELQMSFVRKIVETGHAKRKEQSLKVRQPLAQATIHLGKDAVKVKEDLDSLIKDELNVKTLNFIDSEEIAVEFDTTLTPELEAEGKARDIIRKIQDERKKLETNPTELVDVVLEEWPEEFEEEIKRKTFTAKLTKGTFAVNRH